jgi:hypothetical protein
MKVLDENIKNATLKKSRQGGRSAPDFLTFLLTENLLISGTDFRFSYFFFNKNQFSSKYKQKECSS